MTGRNITTIVSATMLAIFYSTAAKSIETDNKTADLVSLTRLMENVETSIKINLDANRFKGIYADDQQDDYQYDSQLRRARLTLKLPIFNSWSSKLQVAINEGDDTYDIKDLYLKYDGFDVADIKIGKFKEPFGLENITSSANNPFTERAMSIFAIGRNKGISFSNANSKYSWNIGAYDIQQNGKVKADANKAYTARATFSPTNTVNSYSHMGLSYSKRDLQGVEYEIKTNGGVDSAINFIDTKNIATETIDKSGLELAWGRGPLSLQSEYQQLQINAIDALEDATYKGYYGQISYFLTADHRAYKKGRLSKVTPSSTNGAWELSLRKGIVQSVEIGVENNNSDIDIETTVLGLNYYHNSKIQLMLNAIDTDVSAINTADVGSALSLRLQIRI
ncbi:porin [Porticoccaceae bacterium]|nr:porin [Porticoccaceae bacterium]MDA9014536.1 porin [Porticoccaceae bacterium]